LVWADELFVFLHGSIRRIWAPIGEAIRQRLDVEWGCDRLSLAVEPIAGSLEWHWIEATGEAGILPIVVAWAEEGIRAVVWDGAPAHTSHRVRQQAADHALALIRQPAHSPELNPAERVIQHLRAALEGRVYTTLEEKKSAVEGVLNELALDPERVRRLTRWGWIHQAILNLPE
jgi:transposase